jgi:hypothetical protein
MQQLTFESSPGWVVVCLACALGYAWLLYKAPHPWSLRMNRVLFGVRWVVAFILGMLLLGPIVRAIRHVYEKPVAVIVVDTSSSIRSATDSLLRLKLETELRSLTSRWDEQGFETLMLNLQGEPITQLQFTAPFTNLHEGLRNVVTRFEGKNIHGVVLVSDGIFNVGLSPVYGNYPFPVHTLGVGDTLVRNDLAIRNVAYNKIAYQGNRFPVKADVTANGMGNQPITAVLLQNGKELDRKVLPAGAVFSEVDFLVQAETEGLQRWDIEVRSSAAESNRNNNHASIFIDIVKGRKKILLIAPTPHPDIKALRAVVDKNPNYEFLLHIPGLSEVGQEDIEPHNVDLVIFHQAPDVRGKTRDLYQRFMNANTSVLVVLGAATDFKALATTPLPVQFEQVPRQFDEVTPVINPVFPAFSLRAESNTAMGSYPPVNVHFGKWLTTVGAMDLLVQRVGSVATQKALLTLEQTDQRKVGVMLGEGFWRWRLHEYSKTNNTEAFDELWSKVIQYLATVEEKSRFKSYPVLQQVSETEPIVFESQVYNALFEPVFGQTIDIAITPVQGKRENFSYVTSVNNTRYEVGGLPAGTYRYIASTVLDGHREEVKGKFMVTAQQLEMNNVTADFDVLKAVSANTGGRFYPIAEWERAQQELTQIRASSILHTEETYDSLIRLKWIFFLVLILASGEWFLRKFFGGY